MITFFVEENNPLSQNFYDSCVSSIQLHQLTCSCKHSGCLHIHGYYKRKVKDHSGFFILNVCRLICSECGKTHALLPSSIVPYSQISLVCCCQILHSFHVSENVNSICRDYPDIDENNVKSVIRRYLKYWKERLCAFRISLAPIRDLVIACFSHYSLQFLQIRRTVNLIHPKTT